MLHPFAVLSWPKITGLLVAAFVVIIGWLKRKVIAAAWNGVTEWCKRSFWSWVHRQVSAHAPPTVPSSTSPAVANHHQHAVSKQRFFIIVQDDGTTVTVPVTRSSLLEALRGGDSVEIDAQVGIYYDSEVAQRVRQKRKTAYGCE